MTYVWESLATAVFCHKLIENETDLLMFYNGLSSQELDERIDINQVVDFILSRIKTQENESF